MSLETGLRSALGEKLPMQWKGFQLATSSETTTIVVMKGLSASYVDTVIM
jgi:hypothetical protein